MRRLLAVLVLGSVSVHAQTITEIFGSGANQFSIDFVGIGNASNEADTTGTPNPVGRVDYVYNIGKYEISRGIIEKANIAGSLGLTMGDLTFLGGNGLDRPATGITWNEAARFVNWLNTSKGYQAAYNFTTSGPNDNVMPWAAGQFIGNNGLRHKDAYFFLPSVDEWYKAAYGSPGGIWYKYPTGSNIAPKAVTGGTESGTAVYGQIRPSSQGPADVNNAGGLSAFGTMGQGGNAWEWNESPWNGPDAPHWRELRGGSYADSDPFRDVGAYFLQASTRTNLDPTYEYPASTGFRVASVPEPSSLSLLLAGGAVLMAGRRLRRVQSQSFREKGGLNKNGSYEAEL